MSTAPAKDDIKQTKSQHKSCGKFQADDFPYMQHQIPSLYTTWMSQLPKAPKMHHMSLKVDYKIDSNPCHTLWI
jgi:hypothetical protein